MGFTTASEVLLQADRLALSFPALNPKPNGKAVLIWGGASSVGCNAIQLGVAAGDEVYTTRSSRNFDLCRKTLGASSVFDYGNADVVSQIVTALKYKTIMMAQLRRS